MGILFLQNQHQRCLLPSCVLGLKGHFWWKSAGKCDEGCEKRAWIYVSVLTKGCSSSTFCEIPAPHCCFLTTSLPLGHRTALFIHVANCSGKTPTESSNNKGRQRERQAFLVLFGVIQRFGGVPGNETELSICSFKGSRSDPCPHLPQKSLCLNSGWGNCSAPLHQQGAGSFLSPAEMQQGSGFPITCISLSLLPPLIKGRDVI